MFEKEQNDYLDCKRLTDELSLVDPLAREEIYENFDIICFNERIRSDPINIPLR
tara:strand:+ start:985 stop:1146 length:162 start_codon:yes stop_codon:yes gene_type:complete